MTAPAIQNDRFHPFISLILLFGLVLISAGIFQLLAVSLAVQLYDVGSIQEFSSSFEKQLQHPDAMILVQGISAIGTFILPAIIYTYIAGSRPFTYFQLNRPASWILIGLAILILLTGQSVVNISAYFNQQLSFPEWMKGFGDMVSDMNTKVEQGYELFLNIQSIPRLLIMLVVAGILPAFGEEFLFRGIIQKNLHRWTNNGHWAVWIAAIIFSLIHFQVLNFLPRLLLGAMLGYLFLWSGNLWYSIAAHLFNNAALLIYAYYFLQNGGELKELQQQGGIQWLPALISTVVFVGLLYFFKERASHQATYENGS